MVLKVFFQLGIFTSGLSSFGSSDSQEEDEEVEPTTAGLELTIRGTQLRPFVFFNGQGELMGHVWAGTASDRTTAYQALILLQDHLEYLRLGSGFIVELNLRGAVSFDLAGKVEISLWGRTANSLVEKRYGNWKSPFFPCFISIFVDSMKVRNPYPQWFILKKPQDPVFYKKQ